MHGASGSERFCESGFNRRAINAFLGNENEMTLPRRARAPRLVELMAEAGSHTLNKQAHGLVCHINEIWKVAILNL
jgi:hypothetical protein